MDLLIIASLVVEVLVLSRLDRKVFGTWITPFTLLAYPYLLAVASAYFLAPSLDFIPMYSPSILIWSVGLFVFWTVGFLLGWGIFGGHRVSRPFAVASLSNLDESSTAKTAMKLSWVIMPLLAYGLYKSQAAAGGWIGLGTYDFKEEYSRGLGAHAVVLAYPLVILLLGLYQKGRKAQLLTALGLLLFLLLSQVKGTLLAPLIGAAVFRSVRGGLKLSFRGIAIAAAVVYTLFNLVYLLGFWFTDSTILWDADIYGYLARHFLYYLWAGVLSLSEALRSGVETIGGPWYVLFSPFINLYRSLLSAGPLVPAGSPHELGINPDLNFVDFQGSNVYTIFGTLYFYLGPLAAVLLILVVSFLYYGALLVCRFSTNVWYLVLYSILASWLVFGFFEYYFWHLLFIETAFYCFVLAKVQQRLTRASTVACGVSPFRSLTQESAR